MSLKGLLGLEDTEITDIEIIERIREAMDKKVTEVEFVTGKGDSVKVNLKERDFSNYIDSWDGKTGRNSYPNI